MRKFLLLAVVLLFGAVSAYANPIDFEFLGFDRRAMATRLSVFRQCGSRG